MFLYQFSHYLSCSSIRLFKFGGKTDEGASIISGNSIVGEKEDLDDDDSDRYEPKMLLFNGLYYHGNWATPFQVHAFCTNFDFDLPK